MTAPDPSIFTPPVISAIVTGSVSLLTVLILSHFNRKQHHERLDADGEEAERKRSHELRKQVFIPVAEALSDLQSQIGSLVTAESLDKATEAMSRLGSVTGAMALVSETPTAIRCTRLVSHYTTAYIFAVQERAKVRDAKTDVDTALSYHSEAKAKVTRLTEELRQAQRQPGTSLSPLYQELDSAQRAEFKRIDALAVIVRKYRHTHLAALRAVLLKVSTIDEDAIPLLIGLRRELGVSTDERELRDAMRQNKEDILSAVSAMLDDEASQLATLAGPSN